ncbi:hypothetical protein [Flavobacterium sedimenticola]|uniref:Lipocalin-like domain-containing protein n=1 Tax=Flavobacterium sedimenticola TaxID=3043286 RepID=A0ABT6XPE5_9FLAO|nr:hypothetical protein [Flavobacterium sedimenticola]MDI9256860.1 hypothetical protein [Flavobacterium sedimenticola]
MKIKFILILFVTFSYSSFAQLKSNENGGPPTISELIGYWKKVDYPAAERKSQVNPWPQKYQWFAFYENGKVYSMMMDSDANFTPKELDEIFSALPKEGNPDYKYRGGIMLITNKKIEDYREIWGVNMFAKDINEYMKKGRLMMTLDDGNGKVVYYRLLEKIN